MKSRKLIIAIIAIVIIVVLALVFFRKKDEVVGAGQYEPAGMIPQEDSQ